MRKALIAGIAMAIIASSSPARAQQSQDTVRSEPRSATTHGRLGERLTYLKETLRLSPEQERNWLAYEGALQALVNLHRERMAVPQERGRATDPTQRLRQRAEGLSRLSAALARVADAQEPLYNSLDEAQKLRFAEFSTASLENAPGPRRDEDERYRRSGRAEDFDRGPEQRDRDYDRRDDRDYDRGRRYGRDYDDDTERRERDYRRHGWRDRDYDRRYGYESRRRYGRDYDRDSEWRGREERRWGWRDREDRRDRGYDRGRPDEDYRL